ncbi:MAG: hypothetical protein HY540_04785 [Deltaproteobacteria bacterium]|nr:hypothetical protein [Deltaproteobacteria bacterium]
MLTVLSAALLPFRAAIPNAGGGAIATEASVLGSVFVANHPIPAQFALQHPYFRPNVGPAPTFSDPRVQRFYSQSREDGLNDALLRPFLSSVYGYTHSHLNDVVAVLKIDQHLSPDFPRDIAEATERYLKKLPPRADKNADVILRYSEFERQGAAPETWRKYVRYAQGENLRAERLRPYAVEYILHVPKAVRRALDSEDEVGEREKLSKVGLVAFVRKYLELLEGDINGHVIDCLEELPKSYKQRVMAKLDAYFGTTGIPVKKTDRTPLDFEQDRTLLPLILKTLLKAQAEPGAKNREQIVPVIIKLGLRFLNRSVEFRQHVEGLSEYFPPVSGNWSEGHAILFYDHVKAIIIHGIPHYDYIELFDSSEERASIQASFASLTPVQKHRIEAETALRSLGKFFEEIDVLEANYEIYAIPVKGLPAAMVIDSGSDCSKGTAGNRALNGAHTVYLFTDAKREKLWGYHELYEAEKDGPLYLMSDVMQPSTNIDLKGSVFLKEMQAFHRAIIAQSRLQGEPVVATLVSTESKFISNRTSIELAAEAYLKTAPRMQGVATRETHWTTDMWASAVRWIQYERDAKALKAAVELYGLVQIYKNTSESLLPWNDLKEKSLPVKLIWKFRTTRSPANPDFNTWAHKLASDIHTITGKDTSWLEASARVAAGFRKKKGTQKIKEKEFRAMAAWKKYAAAQEHFVTQQRKENALRDLETSPQTDPGASALFVDGADIS